ncbi:Gfo/Idh/MocA family protein [Chloroflexota bacterium]
MNVGIVGAGLQGRRRAHALKQSKDTRLVAVADINQDAANVLVGEMGGEVLPSWEEVTARKDIDIVVICTPPHLHVPISIAAMKNGKHILCEKPLALNLGGAEEMLAAAKENDVTLKCGFNHRHHPAIKQAYDLLRRGAIGELISVRGRYGIGGRLGFDKEWRAVLAIAGGGQLTDQGSHLVDLSRWFMGEISEAIGFLATSYWNIAPLEDNASVLLRTSKGQVATLHTSWTQWKNLFSFEIFGRDGYILVDGLGGSYGTERLIVGKRDFSRPFTEEVVEFRGEDRSWLDEWQEFIFAIREHREPIGSGFDGLQVLKIVTAVYESVRRGSVTRVID